MTILAPHISGRATLARLMLGVIPYALFSVAVPAVEAGAGGGGIATFEGTLLSKSPHPGRDCGNVAVHQIAKYKIEKIVKGNYLFAEMVVDHLACEGDVFKGVNAGDRVRLTVRVHKDYDSVGAHPGIREYGEKPKRFYVAEELPKKIRSAER